MPLTNDPDILAAALLGYQERRKEIDERIRVLRERLGPLAEASHDSETFGGRRALSPEARARIAAAQKKRWAAAKGPRTSKASGPNRLSAEGRARIIEATKKRWAEFRAAAAKAARQKPATNKGAAAKKAAASPAAKRRAPKRAATARKSGAPATQPTGVTQPAG